MIFLKKFFIIILEIKSEVSLLEMCFNDIVSNVKIYDLEESLKASGYPMRTDLNYTSEIDKDVNRW